MRPRDACPHREGGQCNAAGRCVTQPPTLTPKCNPENYLDRSPGPAFSDEDNARFVDRNDAAGRSANRDGFIRGPVTDHDGTTWVNDRLAVISYDDLMPRVMRRVAEEVSACLRDYAARSDNHGRLPWGARCRSHDPIQSCGGPIPPERFSVAFPIPPFLARSRQRHTLH